MTTDIAERTATLIALILLFGAAVFRLRVGAALMGAGDDYAVTLVRHARRLAAAAASVLVVIACVRLHLHVVALFDGWRDVGVAELKALMVRSTWGHAWILHVVSAGAIALAPMFGKALDGWLAPCVAISAAMNGHAATGDMPVLTVGADAVHAIAAGAWIGGVFMVMVATSAARPESLLRVVRAFSPVALTCAGVLVTTGLFAAYVHIGSFAALRTSEYGAQLVVKLFLIALVLAAGAWNWKRATPALARGDTNAIRRGVAIEMMLALTVIIATARLVVLEPPSSGP